MKGAVGRTQIDEIMRSYRSEPPAEVGERKVLRWFDRQDSAGPFGNIRSSTDRSSRDMLVYELENNARIILRPSGTEPKAKIYVEIMGKDVQSYQVVFFVIKKLDSFAHVGS